MLLTLIVLWASLAGSVLGFALQCLMILMEYLSDEPIKFRHSVNLFLYLVWGALILSAIILEH